MSRVEATEVIELDSDEESSTKKTDKKPATACSNCINFQCSSGYDLKPAPSFACAFYGVSFMNKRKRLICQQCFDKAMDHQETLVTALHNKTPILKCEFPDRTMEVEISDSEDSDDDKKENLDTRGDHLPEDFLLDLEKKLDSALENVFEKYDIDYQLDASHKILKSEWNTINERNQALDKNIMAMIKKMDSLRNNLYSGCMPGIRMLEDLHISDSSSPKSSIVTGKNTPRRKTSDLNISVVDSEVTPLHAINRSLGYDLPPQGPFSKLLPEVDGKVFIMKHPLMPWVRGKVQQIIARSPLQCRIKLTGRRSNGAVRTVIGKHLATACPSTVLVPVATRVVAVFLDVNSSEYYSGVIAEQPKSTNRYRYLVFFDDGYAQYVLHKYICIVCESSPRVWEDIPAESRDFVKKYLDTYPERPMVKLLPGQVVKTEWNGKWWIARVIQVDGSLVQMHFDADDRTEWIYRGSARLGPLYLELLKANARQQRHHALTNTPSRHRIPLSKSNAPYVEYTSFNPELESEHSNDATTGESSKSETSSSSKSILAAAPSTISGPTTPAPQQSRAVAKKRTAKNPNSSDISGVSSGGGTSVVGAAEKQPSHSIVYYQTQNKIQTRKFVVHKCGPHCVKEITFTPDDLKGYSPLSIPLLCGWNRQLCKFPKGKKVTLYQAPCGVRLRNMEELHKYLRMTRSPMSVDLFDFDYWVHCLAEFVLDKCFVNIKDLSYGVENVPIPCVNEIDHALPDTIRYSTQREPTEGVDINLDPEFLCSCDCTDDCQDKTKCQCWQLTIQGATLGGQVLNNEVGYVYKRLPEPVTTGIYECNSRCKCSVKTCLNRVVQHPLTLKLQVFKTAQRGWGIRCLNDIPLGSFICIYAGRLLTEQGANEGGKNYGDEYLAELDYVEVVEGIKDGYENDVLDPEGPLQSREKGKLSDGQTDEETLMKKPSSDFDEDFNIKLHKGFAELELDSDTSSIRKRLRRRKKSEENIVQDGSEDRSEDGSVSKGSESSAIRATVQDSQEILISDDEDTNTTGRREPSRFEPNFEPTEVTRPALKSVRQFFGKHEAPYIMDAKTTGNIGRYLNHSCDPNVFVQNVFVDTHDVRFPWVAFFALNYIRAGQELTWNYSYDVGSIPGKVLICKCGSSNCRGRLL